MATAHPRALTLPTDTTFPDEERLRRCRPGRATDRHLPRAVLDEGTSLVRAMFSPTQLSPRAHRGEVRSVF